MILDSEEMTLKRYSRVYIVFIGIIKVLYFILSVAIAAAVLVSLVSGGHTLAGIVVFFILAAIFAALYFLGLPRLILSATESRFCSKLRGDGFNVSSLYASVCDIRDMLSPKPADVLIAFDTEGQKGAVMFAANPFDHYIFHAKDISTVIYSENSDGSLPACFRFSVFNEEIIVATCTTATPVKLNGKTAIGGYNYAVTAADPAEYEEKACGRDLYRAVSLAMRFAEFCRAFKEGFTSDVPIERGVSFTKSPRRLEYEKKRSSKRGYDM